ncbi:DUF742 domain-containing protein [Streptomyces sp. G7(2002)]|uniref:DUF742 domain-containing protein n=1 Tax=Streptomyces sp. G7(2002) TaxID=2971798 RepID=UPI00237D8F45|nr:DUF742 domain-containing protein [Streptomyces sp. G7(2002)]WDT53512.1 DUF742 domain-containing protein [Streptomyces sp. G7(2002)]
MSDDWDVPDRSFVVLGGRTAADYELDAVSLIVTERDDTAGLGLEEAAIVRMCTSPTGVVEIASRLCLPVGMAQVLISGLLDRNRVTARHPPPATAAAAQHGVALLEEVLVGLRNKL